MTGLLVGFLVGVFTVDDPSEHTALPFAEILPAGQLEQVPRGSDCRLYCPALQG